MGGEVGSRLAALVTDRVKDLMREQGISSGRELARRIGKSHQWLFGLFNGKQPYDLDDLDTIAEALGTTAERLLGIGPAYLPLPVQRTVDAFADEVMRQYQHPRAGAAERRALLSVVRQTWRRHVWAAMDYWRTEIERETIREPGFKTTPSRKRTR